MILRRKNVFLVITAALLAAVLNCSCGKAETSSGQITSEAPYHGFFDQSVVHRIDVKMSDSDLQDQRKNPLEKTKYAASITIDGEEFNNVAFSTKGNSSLTDPAEYGSYRLPYKLNFGKFVKNQTYYGLDKMNLSSLYEDASGMRDWLAYRIMEEAGIDAPLTTYVWLTINGEDIGLYLAVEEIGDSWLERTGRRNSSLYKPEPQMADMDLVTDDDDKIAVEEGMLAMFQNRIRTIGSPKDTGAALVYINDQASSYPDIFNNAETDVSKSDQARLIQSLKALNDPSQRSSVLNAEEIIRYFTAHNFILSADSYTGITVHNYYLLEQDGILSIYPWDYNNSFGLFLYDLHPEKTWEEIVSWPMDSPLMDADAKERPLWAWITEEEDSLRRYHAEIDRLLAEYFESGMFEKEFDAMAERIRSFQIKDPTAFYPLEAAETDCQILKGFCLQRAAEIRRQLRES